MGKKEKEKDSKKKKKDKKKKEALVVIKKVENCKSSCCEKYRKSENKRCKRCPMFDLIKKVA
ncbi:hypothetical protein SAMN05192550_0380 [Flavobacterium glycines]|jgi:hypothetical protein|uniref:Uncharacterized protein n=1 Tax=Flavobacterium glycines TaxID=551990 RepID=A0A1B9DPD1_9FLAO|nr:hypothetical protein [Flavobacterium glycines]OCB71549.1 hypothetical protein FBGL_09940 [Flavobacterium glycines]GEL10579.1 hypothetical protein FGL01_13180 [Flavobacterium glycines]SDI62563.1 hypothetical protein SAMN05192550_0380 [Flavobacterium glycines]